MRIAIDLRMFNSSGIGTVIQKLVPLIIDAHKDSHFYLLGREHEIPVSLRERPNTSFIRCSSPIYSISEQLELPFKIPARIDLFWAPHYNIPLFYTGRLLVTVHDVLHLAMPEYVKGIHKRIYARSLFLAIKHRAAGIICDSAFTAQELQRLAGIPAERITVIHNGIDAPSSTAIPPPINKKPYFLFVGNVKPHKNLYRLVLAFESIATKVPHDLVIVGKKDGFITGDNEAQKAAVRLGDRVKFTGRIDDSELAAYYAHADALAFPSLYEGFGFPPLEAMRYQIPVKMKPAPKACGPPDEDCQLCPGADLYDEISPPSPED